MPVKSPKTDLKGLKFDTQTEGQGYPSTSLLHIAKTTHRKSFSLIWMLKPKMQSSLSTINYILRRLGGIPNQNLRFHPNRRVNPPHCQCPLHPCPWSKAFFEGPISGTTKWWFFRHPSIPIISHCYITGWVWNASPSASPWKKGGDEKQLSWFTRNFTEAGNFGVEVWKWTLMFIGN